MKEIQAAVRKSFGAGSIERTPQRPRDVVPRRDWTFDETVMVSIATAPDGVSGLEGSLEFSKRHPLGMSIIPSALFSQASREMADFRADPVLDPPVSQR